MTSMMMRMRISMMMRMMRSEKKWLTGCREYSMAGHDWQWWLPLCQYHTDAPLCHTTPWEVQYKYTNTQIHKYTNDVHSLYKEDKTTHFPWKSLCYLEQTDTGVFINTQEGRNASSYKESPMVQMFFGGWLFFVNVNRKCNLHFFGGLSEQKILIRHHFLLIAVSGLLSFFV